jgi:phosphoribosylamine---glycine ligase
MKIAFISKWGEAADIAFRMCVDGNDVRLYIQDPQYGDNFQGLLRKEKDWRNLVRWADLFFFDDQGCNAIWEQVHKQVPCFGGSSFGAKLEKDRHFAQGIMKRCGLETNENHSFKTFKEAINYLKSNKKRHVIKPQGKDVQSHHLIIGKREDNKDAIDRMELMVEKGLKVDSVEVEEYRGGVEAALTMWFNGINKVGPVLLNHEHKHSHEKETGCLTAEMGTLAKYMEEETPFYEETLKKVIPILRAADYRGQVDIGFKVTEEGYFPNEFTTRIGKPTWALEDEVQITPWADIAYACATGKSIDLRVHYDWCVGVVLTAFGFPHDDKVKEISEGLVIDGLDENNLDHIHPWNVRLNKKGEFVIGHGQGQVLIATGRGESIELAKTRAYDSMSTVKIPNGSHRFDISDKIDAYELDRLGILPLEEARV